MRRWTNGLPGATERLGANLALRGLAVSQCRMRADTHPGPEHRCSTPEVLYINAAFTFARSTFRLATHGRAIHIGTIVHLRRMLPEGATVPLGWIAVGDPDEILPPYEHG